MKCDICNRKDGYRGFELWQCKSCKVNVHKECYLINPDDKHHQQQHHRNAEEDNDMITNDTAAAKLFTCKACIYTRKTQMPFPVQCELCCVKEAGHAMHELYDEPGNFKRRKSIGWVHTICALFICSNSRTRGCVYGVDRRGNWDGSSGDDDETLWELDHFVIADGKDKESQVYKKTILEHRKSLVCNICKNRDDTKSARRIPVQCSVGDDSLSKKYQSRFPEGALPCSRSFHVGCAIWRTNKDQQRVFFFPGKESEDNERPSEYEPQVFCFCGSHAAILSQGTAKPTKQSPKRKESDSPKKPSVSDLIPLKRKLDGAVKTSPSKRIRQKSLDHSKKIDIAKAKSFVPTSEKRSIIESSSEEEEFNLSDEENADGSDQFTDDFLEDQPTETIMKKKSMRFNREGETKPSKSKKKTRKIPIKTKTSLWEDIPRHKFKFGKWDTYKVHDNKCPVATNPLEHCTCD